MAVYKRHGYVEIHKNLFIFVIKHKHKIKIKKKVPIIMGFPHPYPIDKKDTKHSTPN